MTHKLRIRPATMDDAKNLFDWRNDPLTRQQSRNTDELLWEPHIVFLTKVVQGANPSRHLYIVEDDKGTPVGTVRTDGADDGSVEISYTVAPELRGQGIGKAMVVQFAKEFLEGKKIKAVIKKGHEPSEGIARALGLSATEETEESGTDGIPLIVWR